MLYIVDPITTYRSSLSSGAPSGFSRSNKKIPIAASSSSAPSHRWPSTFHRGPWANLSPSSSKNNTAVTEVYEIHPYSQQGGEGLDSLSSPPLAPAPAPAASPRTASLTTRSRAWHTFVPHKESRFINATTVDHDSSAVFEDDNDNDDENAAAFGRSRIRVSNDVEWSSIHSPP
jgi:hypothetical protein